MHEAVLETQWDFAGWRAAARRLAEAGVAAEDVVWRVGDAPSDLFAAAPEPPAAQPARRETRVPRRFVDLAELAVCHKDAERFARLYRLLCRLQAQPKLLEVATDEDVFAIEAMAKSVRRDRHKMTAFVRFRAVPGGEEPEHVAWFEPEHHILALAAPFFVERFRAMRWTILTPEASARWDLERLSVGPGGTRADAPAEDAAEADWRIYYANIFNPARLKIAAMKREMPVKYWKNLPESRLIAPLIRSAASTEAAMVDHIEHAPPKRAATILARAEAAPQRRDPGDHGQAQPGGEHGLDALRREAAACQLCPLFKDATQTVFGEGRPEADLVFVGEQPGDREDLAGRPFVGPAGTLFDRALGEAGIDRRRAYVTNAVKHFKFEPRGKKRIHKKPGIAEIKACHTWLDRELALLRPRLIIALGSTAVRSLTGVSHSVLSVRGQLLETPEFGPVFVTVHPSFLLRLPDPASQAQDYARFVADLRAAADLAA
jgi:DNA polymerase